MLGERFPATLAAAASGDEDAFADLWRATHPMLLRYLHVLCGDAAEDVAAEAWMKAIRGLDTFHGDEQGFRGWLVVIARNHARDVSRRAARRPEVLEAELFEHQMDAAPDAAEAVLERRSTAAALRLVSTLPRDQAEMVALRVIIGLEVADVARIVGRSPGAVRVAVHRGLRILAAQLRGGASPSATSVDALRQSVTQRVTLPVPPALSCQDV
jgi:RNA polymerase sigma-70 factor, ECF subfamily